MQSTVRKAGCRQRDSDVMQNGSDVVNYDCVTEGKGGDVDGGEKENADVRSKGRSRTFSQSEVPDITNRIDLNFFRGYASIQVHEEMLSDQIRTNAYRYALMQCHQKLDQRTVLEVGAGTGILSVFAVQAGAKKVYAVEACGMASNARDVVTENGMEGRIDVIQQLVEHVQLPEKVDAVISEWMGYCLLYEAILPSVLSARDRFLRPGGLMFPSRATLYLAPVHDSQYLKRLHFWKDLKNIYGVSMETMVAAAHASLSGDAEVKIVESSAVQAPAVILGDYDLTTVSAEEVLNVQKNFHFKCFGQTTITGFVTWWTTDFPGGSTLNTSPYHPSTHWKQVVFHLSRSFAVEKDAEISGTFKMYPHHLNYRCMQMELNFMVGGSESHQQIFSLHSTMPGRSLQEEPSTSSAFGKSC